MEVKKRNTRSKQMVLEMLQASPNAMSQEMLEQQLGAEINRVTIYRILHSFEEDGTVHRIVSDSGKTFYALCKNCGDHQHNDKHPHFQCTVCNKLECLPEEVPVKVPKGYKLYNTNITLTGICRECNKM
jgi:Fur family transcriptional regulator, ferric uptake regulator